jgi:hypothetical protein
MYDIHNIIRAMVCPSLLLASQIFCPRAHIMINNSTAIPGIRASSPRYVLAFPFGLIDHARTALSGCDGD